MSQEPSATHAVYAERDHLLSRIQELESRCIQAENALRAMEAQNQLLGDSAPFGIVVLDTEGRILGANQKMRDMLAWPPDRDIKQLNLLQHPSVSTSGAVDAFRRSMTSKTSLTSDHSCLQTADGCAHLRYHICPVLARDGTFNGIIAFIEDITELKLAEEAIKASENKYRLLFESSPVAMVERDAGELKQYLDRLRDEGITDLDGFFDRQPQQLLQCFKLIKTVNCNSAFLELMEAKSRDEIDWGFATTNSPEEITRIAREIVKMVANGKIANEREETFRTVQGTLKSVLGKSLPLSGHEDTLSRIVVALVDITKRKEAEEALRQSERRFREQAIRDNLTGLYNRRYLYQSLNELIERAKADGSVLSVVFMDLDHFKTVVDTYGHLNGSHAVREVAKTIREAIETPAYAVAYAGDEFVLVLPGKDQGQAVEQAEIIRAHMQKHIYLQDRGYKVHIQSSFGIATFPQHAADMTELLAAADHALFGVKASGKAGIRLYDSAGIGGSISGNGDADGR